MMHRILPLVVLVAALAALAGTITYAVDRAANGGSHYGSMMNDSGYRMMGANGKQTRWYLNGSGPVKTVEAARARARQFASPLGLETSEVIQFTDNFYVRLDDATGKPATEVLVDPQSGAVTLEYGPAMMWNTRYGMMRTNGTAGRGGMMGGGMMGGSSSGMMSGGYGNGMMGGSTGGGMMSRMMGRYGTSPSWTPGNVSGPVTATKAHALANRWLTRQDTGESAGDADSFPGYYTMETLANGKIAGMISVNKTTGAVWYHWWHGRFVASAE